MRISSDLRRRQGGFTLAEVAVTIVIVGIALMLLLQGLGGSKAQSYYTRNLKVANQLARQTLGEVAAGLYEEDAEFGLSGTYADSGYPEFSYEVWFGEEDFPADTGRDSGEFDSWEHQREREREQRERERDESGDDEEDDEEHEPYEKVRIRVVFPVIGSGYDDHYTLTEWIAWEQVYGEDEEDEDGGDAGDDQGGSGSGAGGRGSGGGGSGGGGGSVRQRGG